MCTARTWRDRSTRRLRATAERDDVIDGRQQRGSLLITSQYPVDKWHGLFPDQTVTDATLDRFVHTSHRLNLKGESMRKLRAKLELEAA